MYKILLVEDEQDVLNAMVSIVPWKDFGFNRPVACPDGREAINAIENGFYPDVIITDIYMPFVDGLDVAEYAKKNLPNTIVVLLSGYDEFKYAQKAVQHKVYDYILKPITPKDMNALLKKLSSELNDRSDSQRDSAEITKTHFLNQLLSKRMDSVTIQEGLKEHQIHFPFEYNVVMTLDVDLSEPSDITARKNLDLMRYGVLNVSQELAEEEKNIYLFLGLDGCVKCICSDITASKTTTRAYDFAKKTIATFENIMHITVSAGIGETGKGINHIYHSHSQSASALYDRFFEGRGSILQYNTKKMEDRRDIDYLPFEKELQKAIKTFEYKKGLNVIEEMTDEMEKKRPSMNRCIFHCQQLMSALVKLTSEIVGSSTDLEVKSQWNNTNFYSVLTLRQVEEIMLSLCKKAFFHLEVISGNPATLQMIKSEQFILDNYNDPDLSLNMITEYLAVSTSYFSTNFKSRTGSTFVEYLTNCRMEKAKEILTMTNRRTYEVADDVGYSDPQYFSSSFKKAVGISPKEYREKHNINRKNI